MTYNNINMTRRQTNHKIMTCSLTERSQTYWICLLTIPHQINIPRKQTKKIKNCVSKEIFKFQNVKEEKYLENKIQSLKIVFTKNIKQDRKTQICSRLREKLIWQLNFMLIFPHLVLGYSFDGGSTSQLQEMQKMG